MGSGTSKVKQNQFYSKATILHKEFIDISLSDACSICLDEKEKFVTLNCGNHHTMCSDCYQRYTYNVCHMCRQSLYGDTYKSYEKILRQGLSLVKRDIRPHIIIEYKTPNYDDICAIIIVLDEIVSPDKVLEKLETYQIDEKINEYYSIIVKCSEINTYESKHNNFILKFICF